MGLWEHLKKRLTTNLSIVIASIAVITGILFTQFDDYRWVGHGIIGLTAFSFLAITMILGAILARKIRRPPNHTRFPLHRKFGIAAGILTTTTLVYGFWMVIAREYPLLNSIHGRVGLLILTLALTQIIAGYNLVHHKSMSFIHHWSGYFLIGLTGIQIILGIFLTPVVAGETPRYTLRLSTPPVEGTWLPDGTISRSEYFFKRILDDGNYEISYRTDGKYIAIGLKVKTTGWVGVGISAGEGMLNADIVFAHVSDSGEVVVEDQFGTGRTTHLPDTELGGTDGIVASGGKEEDGFTIIEFKRPLVSDDKFDISLANDVQTVMWAYARTDSSEERHVAQGVFDITLRPK